MKKKLLNTSAIHILQFSKIINSLDSVEADIPIAYVKISAFFRCRFIHKFCNNNDFLE